MTEQLSWGWADTRRGRPREAQPQERLSEPQPQLPEAQAQSNSRLPPCPRKPHRLPRRLLRPVPGPLLPASPGAGWSGQQWLSVSGLKSLLIIALFPCSRSSTCSSCKVGNYGKTQTGKVQNYPRFKGPETPLLAVRQAPRPRSVHFLFHHVGTDVSRNLSYPSHMRRGLLGRWRRASPGARSSRTSSETAHPGGVHAHRSHL